MVGPQSRSERGDEKKNPCLCWELNSSCPARSLLAKLSYLHSEMLKEKKARKFCKGHKENLVQAEDWDIGRERAYQFAQKADWFSCHRTRQTDVRTYVRTTSLKVIAICCERTRHWHCRYFGITELVTHAHRVCLVPERPRFHLTRGHLQWFTYFFFNSLSINAEIYYKTACHLFSPPQQFTRHQTKCVDTSASYYGGLLLDSWPWDWL
jgi:hypothetical protein